MDIEQFIQGIKFKDIQPMQDGVGHYANVGFEFSNTVFPEEDNIIKNKLGFLKQVPKYCTITIAGVINKAVQLMPEDQVYLNIGSFFGYSLFAGMLGNKNKSCIGIDNFSDPSGDSHNFHTFWETMKKFNQISKFYEMDYVDYLKNVHKEQIGVYYYDAIHHFADQYRALDVAEKFFAPGCIVLIDDINCNDPRNATDLFLKERGDLYETLLFANTSGNGHPTWWNGIYIFRKKI